MSFILAVSGKKQSGKSSLCSYIEAYLTALAYKDEDEDVRNGEVEFDASTHFQQREDGTIAWEWGTKDEGPGTFDGLVKVYSFADSLKDVCVNVLGLRHEQCYGTDDQKNSLTKFKWENLPQFIRWVNNDRVMMYPDGTLQNVLQLSNEIELCTHVISHRALPIMRTGPMTGREVMQVFGTDVMRKMFDDDIWVRATVERISREQPTVALIADMRFRSEFKALYASGAHVIRLERNILHDTHSSELDFDGFDWSPYERVLTIPAECGIHEKNRLALSWLQEMAPDTFTP